MAKSRKQRKSQKRHGGGLFDGWFGKSEPTANGNKLPNAVPAAPVNNGMKPANASVSVNNSKKNNMNKTTQMQLQGGMQLEGAPVNYKSPMFFPTEKTMQWATTAGIPTPKGMHGGRRTRRHRRRHHKSKRSQRK